MTLHYFRENPELPAFDIADFFETPGIAVIKRKALVQLNLNELSLRNRTRGLKSLVAMVLFIQPKPKEEEEKDLSSIFSL